MLTLAVCSSVEAIGHRTPAGELRKQTVHRALQHRGVIADLGRFPECLIDDRVEGDDATDEFPSNSLRIGQLVPGQGQRARKTSCNPGR